jgi:adenosylcobinamide-phosphate synthase
MNDGHPWQLLGAALSPLWWAWQALSQPVAEPWAHHAVAAALAVPVALLVDRLWGEPPVWMHPVVAMGRLLGAAGRIIAPREAHARDWPRFALGATAWCLLALLFFAIYAFIQCLLPPMPWWLGALVLGVLLKPLLSWRMLRDEVLAVEAALQQSLPAGRERLTWLVSRDTTQLDAGQVRESAIETLAENLSDSVLAPLLWFAVAGLPGAALYRFANTADAMWGYPGWRGQGDDRRHWQWAGKWTARADDLLNWIPARLTALLLVLCGLAARQPVGWRALRQDAGITPSPNGGWPMGAMARLLGVRLGKPGVYMLNPAGRVPEGAELRLAVRHAGRVVAVLALAALAAALALALLMAGKSP